MSKIYANPVTWLALLLVTVVGLTIWNVNRKTDINLASNYYFYCLANKVDGTGIPADPDRTVLLLKKQLDAVYDRYVVNGLVSKPITSDGIFDHTEFDTHVGEKTDMGRSWRLDFQPATQTGKITFGTHASYQLDCRGA